MELPKRPEEMALSRQFGMKLLERRRLIELSQIRTAERAGLRPSEIELLERGLRLPRLDTIVKAAGALEIEPWQLLIGMGWEPENPKEGSS